MELTVTDDEGEKDTISKVIEVEKTGLIDKIPGFPYESIIIGIIAIILVFTVKHAWNYYELIG